MSRTLTNAHTTVHNAPQHDALTLSRLLQERPLRHGSVAGAVDSHDPPVTWCLSRDQVMATRESLAGVVVYVRAEQLDEPVLRVVQARGAAAIVVAGELSSTVLARASQYAPVVSVDAHTTYREINRLVAELSLARETHVLRYGLTVHRSLAELLYQGAGLEALCTRLARLTGCCVAILDTQRRRLALVSGSREELPADQITEALHEHLPAIPGGGRGKEGPDHEPSVGTLHLQGAVGTCVSQPIVLGGRHDGWVALIEAAQPPHPHDLAEHRVVVEQAVTIVGTEMLRTRGIEQAEERARGDFVHALLHGRFQNSHDLAVRAAHYEFPVQGCFGVLVAGLPAGAAGPEVMSTLFGLARDAGRLAQDAGVVTLATVVGDVLAVVRQVEDGSRGEPDAGDRALANFAGVLEREFSRRIDRPAAVAYGRPTATADRIFDSYREARITLALRQRLGLEDACGFQDLRVYATLAELATSTRGRSFADDMLTPLRSSRAGAGDLEESVLAYLSSGGNVNAAARKLHVHRNTMLYKLERASRALQLDLRQAEHQFALWLAYKLDLLAETTATVDRDVQPA